MRERKNNVYDFICQTASARRRVISLVSFSIVMAEVQEISGPDPSTRAKAPDTHASFDHRKPRRHLRRKDDVHPPKPSQRTEKPRMPVLDVPIEGFDKPITIGRVLPSSYANSHGQKPLLSDCFREVQTMAQSFPLDSNDSQEKSVQRSRGKPTRPINQEKPRDTKLHSTSRAGRIEQGKSDTEVQPKSAASSAKDRSNKLSG